MNENIVKRISNKEENLHNNECGTQKKNVGNVRHKKCYTCNLWIWLGVLILVALLLYWIFFIGIDLGANQ